jgi:hypothetical protein
VLGTGLYGRTPEGNNPELDLLAAQGPEAWFRNQFVLDRVSYQRQPATVRVDCTAGCNRAAIDAALLMNPRNPIWAEGNVNLDTGGAFGSADAPVMLIVNGTLTLSDAVQGTGFAYANQISWASAGARWNGAMVSASTFTATANATLVFDRPALNTIRLNYGSFVRAAGGWNLF